MLVGPFQDLKRARMCSPSPMMDYVIRLLNNPTVILKSTDRIFNALSDKTSLKTTNSLKQHSDITFSKDTDWLPCGYSLVSLQLPVYPAWPPRVLMSLHRGMLDTCVLNLPSHQTCKNEVLLHQARSRLLFVKSHSGLFFNICFMITYMYCKSRNTHLDIRTVF